MKKTALVLPFICMMLVSTALHPQEKTAIMVIPLRASGVDDKDAVEGTAGVNEALAAKDTIVITPLESAAPLSDKYFEEGAPMPEKVCKLVKKSGAPKALCGEIARENEKTKLRLWLLNVKTKAFEYQTIEEITAEYGARQAGAAAGRRTAAWLTGMLDTISDLKAGDGDTSEKIVLSWTSSKVSPEYSVQRATSETGDYQEIAKPATPAFEDADAIPGVKYWYRVRGVSGDITTDFSTVETGYRKIATPAGLDLDGVLKEKKVQPPRAKSVEETREREKDEALIQGYYLNPIELNIILMIVRSYIGRGDVIVLRNFDSYTVDAASRTVSIVDNSTPCRISFFSKRLFKIQAVVSPELFDRLMKNAIFFCAYAGDREVLTDDGFTWVIPHFEAIGMGTEYHKNNRNWRNQTLLFGTDNKEYKEKMQQAQQPAD
jgi:hypothetical protein